MAKRFNYTLLAILALAGLFIGAGSDDLSIGFDGADLAFMIFGAIAMPTFLIF